MAKVNDRALFYQPKVAESPFAAIVTQVINEVEVRLAIFNPDGTLNPHPPEKVPVVEKLDEENKPTSVCCIIIE